MKKYIIVENYWDYPLISLFTEDEKKEFIKKYKEYEEEWKDTNFEYQTVKHDYIPFSLWEIMDMVNDAKEITDNELKTLYKFHLLKEKSKVVDRFEPRFLWLDIFKEIMESIDDCEKIEKKRKSATRPDMYLVDYTKM